MKKNLPEEKGTRMKLQEFYAILLVVLLIGMFSVSASLADEQKPDGREEH